MTLTEFLSATDYYFDSVEIARSSPYKFLGSFVSRYDAMQEFGNSEVIEWAPVASVDGYGDPCIGLEIEIA